MNNKTPLIGFILLIFSFQAYTQSSSVIILGLNREHGWHFFDGQGKFILDADNEDYFFSEDLLTRKHQGKWGYVNCKGEWVIRAKYQGAKDFSEGRARVFANGYCYFIDKAGNRINKENINDARDFSDGMACVKVFDVWGYMDSEGNMAIAPQFKKAHDFLNGKAAVTKDKQWVMIDKKGEVVIKPARDYSYLSCPEMSLQ